LVFYCLSGSRIAAAVRSKGEEIYVVPANAGTHTPRPQFERRCLTTLPNH